MSLEETSTSAWETIPRYQHDRYIEHGKKELITRIAHLPDKSSISFVLGLRDAPAESASTQVCVEEVPPLELRDIKSPALGPCRNKICHRIMEELEAITIKVSAAQDLVDQLQKTLLDVVHEEENTAEIERKAHAEEARLELELLSLRTKERDGQYSERLEALNAEHLQLRHQVDKALRTARQLTFFRDSFLPDGAGRVQLDQNPRATVSTPRHDEKLLTHKKRSNQSYHHTGLYRRSKDSDWEFAWSCCMKRGEGAVGCATSEIPRRGPDSATQSRRHEAVDNSHTGGRRRPVAVHSGPSKSRSTNADKLRQSSNTVPHNSPRQRGNGSVTFAAFSSNGRHATAGGSTRLVRTATSMPALLPPQRRW